MRRLTTTEEIKLMGYALNKSIKSGSSRAVAKYGRSAVIKVALGPEGRVQNQNEVNFYRKHKGSSHLAKVYAYGEHLLVMEFVKPMADPEHFWDFHYDIGELDMMCAPSLVSSFLHRELGCTSDNYQLGLSKDGVWKCYDYGFNRKDCEIVGMVGDWDSRCCDEVADQVCNIYNNLVELCS